MLPPLWGAMLLLTLGGAIIEQVNPQNTPPKVDLTTYEDDKPYQEYWCDCHFWLRCKNGESLDHHVGYRGMGKKEARRNSCLQAKSSARYHCLLKESEVSIFAVKEVHCKT